MDMYPDGEWNDRLCSDRLAYICEREADRVIPLVRQRGAKNWYIAYDF